MGGCLFALALVFFFIGIVQLFLPEKRGTVTNQPVQPPFRGTARPMRQAAPAPGFTSHTSTPPEVNMASTPKALGWVQIGDRIRIKHPQEGELTLHVIGRALFTELWQASRGPQSPWVPTGNVFPAFWLETNRLLLNWQTRYYILDEAVALSDVEIQRDFAPHARKFAQSDQTADVYFSYPPAMWHIDDIGKFRVGSIDGEGIRMQSNAVGRFVHASGDGGRGLVLEDYEGGGGQDTVWIGYKIEEADIQKT